MILDGVKFRTKVLVVVGVALLPGAVWGVVSEIVEAYVYQATTKVEQNNMQDQLDRLDKEINRMDRVHNRKRKEIRDKTEQVQNQLQEMRGDVKVIRKILEEREKQ